MKIVRIEKSSEECQQASWQAVNVYFDTAVNQETILSWNRLGSLVYLKQLKQPFYKISAPTYLIKGIEGKNVLRIGSSENHEFLWNTDWIEQFLFSA